ncbi:SDR family oxidoreductase [Xanthomonas sp. Kuri4-3]
MSTVLITGCSSGFGLETAQLFLARGWHVVATMRTPQADGLPASDRLRVLALDITDPASIARAADEVRQRHGRLDILVNNAGTIRRADAVDFTEQDWDEVMDLNLKSAFFLAQAAGRHFIAQGRGKIINVASMLSFQGGIRVPSYTASKSGMAGITRLLANEWAGKGVNVNAIAPGYMATDNTAQLRADAQRNTAILERIPAGRWGTPEDLGGTAVFLASRASDYVNGAVIPVDGGWLAR